MISKKNESSLKVISLFVLLFLLFYFSINNSKKYSQNKSKVSFKQFWKLSENNGNNVCTQYSKINQCQNVKVDYNSYQIKNQSLVNKRKNQIKQCFYYFLEIATDTTNAILYNLYSLYNQIQPKILRFYHTFALIFISNKPTQLIKYQPKFYRTNFANSRGGAKILMKSNQQLRHTSKILQQQRDTYMYTQSNLPFSVIIGLTQQVSIQQVIITSSQIYSRTIKQFMIQGIFTYIDDQWMFLGKFKAEKSFNPQSFKTQNKIVRYIRLTVLSCYQSWSYFTLSQIQVNGKGLFADAVIQKHQQNNKKINNIEKKKKPTCQNNFDQFIENNQKGNSQDQNLISVLIHKIQKLQQKNNQQNQKIKQMRQNSKKIDQILSLKQDYQKTMRYLLMILSVIAILIIFSCVCFCYLRLLKQNKQTTPQLIKTLSKKSNTIQKMLRSLQIKRQKF